MDSFFRNLWLDYLQFVRTTRDASCLAKNKDVRWKEFSVKNKAHYRQLISQESFKQILNRLQHIQELAYTVTGYDDDVFQLGKNVSEHIRSTHQIIRFNAQTAQSKVIQLIFKAYEASTRVFDNKVKRIGYVKGTDSSNYETTINFDDFSDDLFKTRDSSARTLKLNQLEDYPPIKEMLDKFRSPNYGILL